MSATWRVIEFLSRKSRRVACTSICCLRKGLFVSFVMHVLFISQFLPFSPSNLHNNLHNNQTSPACTTFATLCRAALLPTSYNAVFQSLKRELRKLKSLFLLLQKGSFLFGEQACEKVERVHLWNDNKTAFKEWN